MISNLKDLWHRLTAPRTTDEDEARREDIANVMAERERLLATERAQARRQAALLRLSAELAATLEETEVCRRVVDGLHDTLGYDHLVLWLVDQTSSDRVLVASVGFVEPPTRIPPGQGLSERPLLDGQLHYTPDVTQDPRYIPGLGGSEVDVPVRIGGKVLGVLIAESKQSHAFSQDDFEVLTAAAQQTGLAIEKARLLAAERQRADELDALRTTMADITAELELSALLQVIVERAAGLLDATGGELGLYDEASQEIRIVVSHNLGEGYVGTSHALGEGAMGRVAETGEPLIIEDYHTWEGRAPQYADVHVHASLNAPLEVGGRLVGVISIAATDPARQFGPADLHLLKLFAQQAAIAIENARLYEGARQRAEELGAINEIAQTVTSSLDLDKVIRSVMKGINRILRVETGSLLLVDEETNELVFKITLQGDTEKLAPYRLKMGQGIAGWVAQRGEPLLVPDVQLDPRHYGAIDETIGFTSRSILCVPLTVKDKVIGVIEVINKLNGTSPDSEARLDENDLKLLSSMAAPVAIAIENARLYDQAQREIAERKRAEEEAQRRAAQAALIYEVGRRVSGELELQALLSEIVTVVRDAFDYYSVALGLLDEEAEYLAVWADAGAYADMFPEDHRIAIGEGMTGYAAATGETQISGDVSKDPHYIRAAKEETKSELVVPIKSGQKVIGVLDLQSKEFDAFDETDVMLMETLADQVAVAIENAWLFEQAQEEIAERVRAEAELRKYQEHLEELVEERTAELRESEERYRTLFDGVPVGLYRTTPAGQVMDVNLAFVQMVGYPDRETLLAVNTATFYVDPEEQVRWRALMEREGVVRDFEVRNRRYDGTVIWLNNTARAVKDEQGQVLYYEGSIEDITERKRAEAELRKYQEHLEELVEERTAELRESEERYRTLFDGVPVGLYRTTPAGQVMDANLAMVQMLGYLSREDLLAVNTADVYVDPEEQVRWRALMEREGVVRDFEIRLRWHDGTVIWVNDTARAVRDQQGQVLYYEGSLEDITERKRFEEEIRRQKDYYEALFVNNPVAVLTADLDANVVSWNPAAEKLFGYTQEEAIGQNADDLVANDESIRAEAAGYTHQVLNLGLERLRVTTKRTCKDGSLVDVEVLGLPIIVAGEKVGFIAIYHDITERKRFEEEIRRQKDYFEALFVNSPVAVLTVDLDANVVSWNPAAEKLFGYTQEEAVGRHLDDLVANDPRVREEALNYTNQLFAMDRVQATAKRTRKDGSLVDVEVLALPVIVAGEKVGFIGIYHDISERKRFEEEIRRQKEYFEALFVNSPVAVVTADLKGNVVSWNPIAERLFGYTQEEVIGRNLDDLVANDDSIRAEAAGYSCEVVNAGRVQATTKRTRKDGSLVDVELLALPVIVAGDKVGSICIYVDIADLQEARRQAEAANQAKSVFLANMSHELRTPLNAILGFTQLMDRDPNLTAAQRENVEIINRSGEHLLALINEVLEMSKIEAGRVTLQETSFDLYRLLDGLEEMFGLRAKDKGLALSFERAENVPQYVRTDEGKLRQVLSNLLGNAVKFTQEGGVALRVGMKEEEPVLSLSKGRRAEEQPSSVVRRSSLVFEVEDTGPGMAPQDLAVVFDPFVQATSGQQPQEGTGLGLSISRQYVRLMGGDITVSSEVGRGSLFKFDVQVGLADAAEVQAAQPRRQVLGLEPNQPIYRLLVAEDKETNRQLLVKLLEPLGFEVKEAVNGQEAIEVWERWEPHLIWMDMRMPVMDGHEATRRIKATTKGQATVIIALTATAFEEDRERILLEGCDDFVRKPFRQDEIYDMLAKHLGVRFVYEEQAPPAAAQPADAAAPLADVLTPAALAALPAGWVDDLQQATIKADLSLILTLIDQIRGENPALADALTDLARNFEYKKILTVIEQAGG